ncbi:hypothetical protein [Vulcanisaeta distributa]|uniref:Uncharacterized protein n=1 Tax=Vulcanisaeta distributa (strain DSM 14429 / JCM 11212 / NBRC 100878 / IC-017) TaxID=572478 RepID=E1QSD7_VULDI|nr:hypothetical protein [Vulcanisaeta distributa]ADN49530.1 hypothetical protein Vdis_0117 [Vulcanisaeta distributa DSM 14429]
MGEELRHCRIEHFKCDELGMRVYERLVEDWRHYDNLLWQIPFGTATVVGVVLTLIYHYLTGLGPGTIMLKLGLLFILLIFVLTMMALSIKIRYFQVERAKCIEEIEQKCANVNVPYETEEAHKIVSKSEAHFESLVGRGTRAYYLQVILFIAIMAVILVVMTATAQQSSTQQVLGNITSLPSNMPQLPYWAQTALLSFIAIFMILLFITLIMILVIFILTTLCTAIPVKVCKEYFSKLKEK